MGMGKEGFFCMPYVYLYVACFLIYTQILMHHPFNFLHLSLCLGILPTTILGALIYWGSNPGGSAWGRVRKNTIPGPRGLPIVGSLLHLGTQAHRRLATLAVQYNAKPLMCFSLGSTRVVISSQPNVAKELLSSASFADRPLQESARQLQFGRAMGFAPYGDYWRNLRRLAANHLFCPRNFAKMAEHRVVEARDMLRGIADGAGGGGAVVAVRPFLQRAAINNAILMVLGHGFEARQELLGLAKEGFELLGAFNIADNLKLADFFPFQILRKPFFFWDPLEVHNRCRNLMPRVNNLMRDVILRHREEAKTTTMTSSSDFLSVLLRDEKLKDEDIISILWEMIFRGTDAVAVLTEWALAELTLHPRIQAAVLEEIESTLNSGAEKEIGDKEVARMPYLQAVVKETLRKHPPGPLLSWARLATVDAHVAGHLVPCGTTVMVNMWAIAHDPTIWQDPETFMPERFLPSHGGVNVDTCGTDLRLAPFGAGRRVCPGKGLGLATVTLWLAHLIHRFKWEAPPGFPVNLTEVLRLSSQMLTPLHARPIDRCSEHQTSLPLAIH